MSENDRGMKKWAPYASLIEQKDYLNRMRKNKERVSKPLLSAEQAEEINDLLLHCRDEALIFRYFKDGFIYEIQQTILSLDCATKTVYGSEISLPLKAIIGLKRVNS